MAITARSLITDPAAYQNFINGGYDLSGYDRYTALPGELSLQSLPDYQAGSFYTVDPAERIARRSLRDSLAQAAGLTVDQARQAEADYRHLGEYTDDYKALMRAYENTDHYRKLKANDEDGALGNIFDESQWTRLPNGQNWFSNLLTAGLYAGAGALMGGLGAAGAAGGSGGGAAGGAAATNAAFALPTATEVGLAAGAGNSALLAGTSAGSLAGAGAAAGGAVGAGANSGSTGNYFNMPGQTEMGLYSGAGDSALLGGTSSGGMGGVGAAGAAAAAGSGGGSGGANGGLMADMTMKDWLGIGATVAGALGSDSPSSHTQTSTNAPPAWLLPYLQQGAGEAGRLYGQGPLQYYPGQTVAPFSQETNAALNMTANRALMGSPVTAGANDQAVQTLRGDYLYGGPGFDRALEASMNRITPMIDSKFASSGRYGSGLHKTALAQAASDSFAGLYDQERGRQARTLALSPILADADYNDMGRLAQVGGVRDQRAQAVIDSDMSRFDYNQNAPWRNLSNFMSIIQGGGFGGTTTQTSPIYRNRAAGLLGGAIAGSDLATDVGWNPTTGAIMGGLLGGWA